MRKLFNDEAGFIVSAELILVLTIAVLGMVVGLASLRDSLSAELNDIGSAFGALDQGYNLPGLIKANTGGTVTHHGRVTGSAFIDLDDLCDTSVINNEVGTQEGADAT